MKESRSFFIPEREKLAKFDVFLAMTEKALEDELKDGLIKVLEEYQKKTTMAIDPQNKTCVFNFFLQL